MLVPNSFHAVPDRVSGERYGMVTAPNTGSDSQKTHQTLRIMNTTANTKKTNVYRAFGAGFVSNSYRNPCVFFFDCGGFVVRSVLNRIGDVWRMHRGYVPKVCSDVAMAVYQTGVYTIC